MTIQIAVRLDDDLVAFLDDAVAQGQVSTRTEGVRVALEKWRREQRISREIAILDSIKDDPDPELDAWLSHTSGHQPPLDD